MFGCCVQVFVIVLHETLVSCALFLVVPDLAVVIIIDTFPPLCVSHLCRLRGTWCSCGQVGTWSTFGTQSIAHTTQRKKSALSILKSAPCCAACHEPSRSLCDASRGQRLTASAASRRGDASLAHVAHVILPRRCASSTPRPLSSVGHHCSSRRRVSPSLRVLVLAVLMVCSACRPLQISHHFADPVGGAEGRRRVSTRIDVSPRCVARVVTGY